MQCPVCEYPDTRPKYRLEDRFFSAAQGRFGLNYCASCRLLFQPETPELLASLESFYPSGYWWKEEGGLGRWERRYREWVVRHDHVGWLKSVFQSPQGTRLLDIGCGGGGFVKMAREVGFDAFGLERSPEAAALAEQAAPGHIFTGTEEALAERSEVFDALTLFHVLEHVPEPFRYLKRLRKLLRPSGMIFVQVPNRESLQARLFGARWYGLDCPRHLYNFSMFSVLHLLGRAGYRILSVQHYSLRDNAAAFVSSLFPRLDPMSRRVRQRARGGGASRNGLSVTAGQILGGAVYFPLVLLAQPFALLEAKLGRGGTIKICASLD